MTEKLILVDESNNEIGIDEKLIAHIKGSLHRAISVFVFNDKKELLIQKRDKNKYHSARLWSNTCCSHPKPKENVLAAAHRRLKEEMGFDCELKEIFLLRYKIKLENNITENECDHVFIGCHNDNPKPNPEEASNYKWISIEKLEKNFKKSPDKYTYWFKIALNKVLKYVNI
ncbi:MAG: isopentenyl-diphosphate Delta-isomerase [Patescibacteria group bacterium]|jgi:isopentenyl-diphosphate delta-isomerase